MTNSTGTTDLGDGGGKGRELSPRGEITWMGARCWSDRSFSSAIARVWELLR